jgi:hypothetical protein
MANVGSVGGLVAVSSAHLQLPTAQWKAVAVSGYRNNFMVSYCSKLKCFLGLVRFLGFVRPCFARVLGII